MLPNHIRVSNFQTNAELAARAAVDLILLTSFLGVVVFACVALGMRW